MKNPDRVVLHGLREGEGCQGCGRSLAEALASGWKRRQQVVEVPPLALEVTEHRAQRKRCLGCGRTTTARFPEEASARVGYGPRIEALSAYLMGYQLLPYERAGELIEDLFGEPAPGAGTLHSVLRRCFEGLGEKTQEAIEEGLIGATVGHFDETGLRVEGRGMWVHVASTATLTHYDAVHPKGGFEATKEIGILPRFGGVAVHDGLSSYGHYERCAGHALCNAHHLRELTLVEEEHERGWAGQR